MHPNNTEELLQAGEAWLQQAVDDLRQHAENFMESENVSPEDLAQALGLDMAEIDAILNGDVNAVSLRTFAHVLIANGLALAIEPVQQTPIGGFGAPRFGTQRRGMMPPPPPRMGGFGRPLQHPAFMGHRPMGGMQGRPMAGQPVQGGQPTPMNGEPHAVDAPSTPLRNARGQFIKRQTSANNNPYASFSDKALADIITRNHWNYEIDLSSATRDDMIQFLQQKEAMTVGGAPANRQPQAQPQVRPVAQPRQNVQGREVPANNNQQAVQEDPVQESVETGDAPESKTDAVISAVAEMLKQNPDLADKLAKDLLG